MTPHSSDSGSSRLLLVIVVGLLSLFTTPARAAPTPGLQHLGDVLAQGFNVTAVVDTGIAALASLVAALESGAVNQNGLWGIVNVNNITSGDGQHETSNFLSTIKGKTTTPCAGCPDVAVLFARGTAEPGNVGFLAGPPFVAALQHYFNGTRLAVQGLDYPAGAAGFRAGGSPEGAERMATLANATREACPSARIVLAGYSQGAQVVRKAAGNAGIISSVVLFGDPGNGTAVPGVAADRVFTACHDGDRICAGGSLVTPQHLTYSMDAPAAALFAMSKTGLGMGGGDAVLEGMGDIPMLNQTQNGLGDMVLGDLGNGDSVVAGLG